MGKSSRKGNRETCVFLEKVECYLILLKSETWESFNKVYYCKTYEQMERSYFIENKNKEI